MLEQLIKDAEASPLPGEEGEGEGEGEEQGEESEELVEEGAEEKGAASEPGSPAALFELYVARYSVCQSICLSVLNCYTSNFQKKGISYKERKGKKNIFN